MKKKPVLLLSISQLTIGLIVSLLLILFSITGSFKGFYAIFSGVAGGLQSDSYGFFSDIAGNLNFLGNITSIKDENDMLVDENQHLKSENAELKLKILDNEALLKQLNFDLPYKLEPVRVVRYDENQPGEILINKGSESNIALGAVVVQGKFAVGEVIDVQNKFSRIRLLTSPKSTVAVMTMKNGTKGILRGELGVGLTLTEVLTEQKLEQGEEIITAGVNSNYPYGLRVGEITEIETVQSELTKSAKIGNDIPFAGLHNLFVIMK